MNRHHVLLCPAPRQRVNIKSTESTRCCAKAQPATGAALTSACRYGNAARPCASASSTLRSRCSSFSRKKRVLEQGNIASDRGARRAKGQCREVMRTLRSVTNDSRDKVHSRCQQGERGRIAALGRMSGFTLTPTRPARKYSLARKSTRHSSLQPVACQRRRQRLSSRAKAGAIRAAEYAAYECIHANRCATWRRSQRRD